MRHPVPRPTKTLPVEDAGGKERDDSGKRVIINTVGGSVEGAADPRKLGNECRQAIVAQGRSLADETGTVAAGPYRIPFKAKVKWKRDRFTKKWLLKDELFVTCPLWLVRLSNGRCLHFAENEMSFVT